MTTWTTVGVLESPVQEVGCEEAPFAIALASEKVVMMAEEA